MIGTTSKGFWHLLVSSEEATVGFRWPVTGSEWSAWPCVFFSPGTQDLSILSLSAHISILLPHYFCPAVMQVDPQSPSQDSNVCRVNACPDWGHAVLRSLLGVRIQCCLMQYDDMISSKQSQRLLWCHSKNVMQTLLWNPLNTLKK